MNKKLIFAVTLVAVLALTVAGIAAAQTPQPPARPYAPGTGMGYGRGMMGGGQGPLAQNNANYDTAMHNAMYDALAKGLGLTRADLDARVAKGETPAQIAAAKSISAADFNQIWSEARQAGIDAAVSKGLVTQEQAEWMLNRTLHRGGGFGPGNCPYGGPTPTK